MCGVFQNLSSFLCGSKSCDSNKMWCEFVSCDKLCEIELNCKWNRIGMAYEKWCEVWRQRGQRLDKINDGIESHELTGTLKTMIITIWIVGLVRRTRGSRHRGCSPWRTLEIAMPVKKSHSEWGGGISRDFRIISFVVPIPVLIDQRQGALFGVVRKRSNHLHLLIDLGSPFCRSAAWTAPSQPLLLFV